MYGMTKRLYTRTVKRMARQFPVVLIVGARQCGKTTLARRWLKGQYFDLERPSDCAVFEADVELALRHVKQPVILDEAQHLPSLFPVVRALVDEERRRVGRFYLLGSVNPSLLRHVSESLAGRVGIVEVTPFLFAEVAQELGAVERYWLRGGFPDVCLEQQARRRTEWFEQYTQALVHRDLLIHGLAATPQEMRRVLGMVAHLHGGLLNASDLGRALGVSYHTVNRYLDVLEGHFLIRRLPPWHANLGKRLVKSPKVYLRDSGLLHHLLGVRSEQDLLLCPRRGASWEGMLIEQIIALERLARPGSQFWFYRTHAGAEIDLIVDRGAERIGYEFKCAVGLSRHDASGLLAGLSDGVITTGRIVYAGKHQFSLTGTIEAIPAAQLIDAS